MRAGYTLRPARGPRGPVRLSVQAKSAVLYLALAVHLVLASGYARLVPAFEGPDEVDHYLYTRQLLETGELPVIRGSAELNGLPAWREETMGHHPPVYYLVLAATQVLMGAPDVAASLQFRKQLQPPPEPGPLRFVHGHDGVGDAGIFQNPDGSYVIRFENFDVEVTECLFKFGCD